MESYTSSTWNRCLDYYQIFSFRRKTNNATHLMAAGKVAGHAQLQVGALVREGGREDFARLDVHPDAVDDGPVDVTA